MFIADNHETVVEANQNLFIVDKWCEVETINGWRHADSIIDGDMLIVSDSDTDRVIVCGITIKQDKIYYTVIPVGGDVK